MFLGEPYTSDQLHKAVTKGDAELAAKILDVGCVSANAVALIFRPLWA